MRTKLDEMIYALVCAQDNFARSMRGLPDVDICMAERAQAARNYARDELRNAVVVLIAAARVARTQIASCDPIGLDLDAALAVLEPDE